MVIADHDDWQRPISLVEIRGFFYSPYLCMRKQSYGNSRISS
jgi:hypothetical protein